MQITGILKEKLELIKGVGVKGEWKKQSFVIETPGEWAKLICFDVWGDTIQYLDKSNKGDSLTVDFDPESREYSGKWYTNLKAWKIEVKPSLPTEPSRDTSLPPDDSGNLPF